MNKDPYKDFENQGWEAMFQTLDREMPVKKRRRGLLWLWLCIGGLAIGGGFWYFKSYNNKSVIQTTTSKPIVFDNTLDNQADTTFGKLSKFPKREEHEDVNQTKSDATFRKFSKFPKSEDMTLTTNNRTLGKLSKFPQRNTLATSIDVFIQDSSTTMLTHFSEIGKSESDLTILKPLNPVPLSITQDSIKKIDAKSQKTIIIQDRKTDFKLKWGITTGILTEKGQSLDGFQAGLMAYKSLSKNKVIATGLSFRQIKMSHSSTSYLASTADKNGSAISTPGTLQKTTAISVDKLNYLEMPVTIDWKLSKKFALTTGIKLSYLLSVTTQKRDSSVYWLSSSSYSNARSILYDVSPTSLGLKRWDAAGVGGITYLPTRHIRLGLRYDFGLLNTFNRSSTSAYNRYVGLNLTYLF